MEEMWLDLKAQKVADREKHRKGDHEREDRLSDRTDYERATAYWCGSKKRTEFPKILDFAHLSNNKHKLI